MESIILFLFKNWFLVLIAVGFFYFRLNRRTHEQSTTPRSGMPSFGDPAGARRPADVTRTHAGKSQRTDRVKDEFSQSVIVNTQPVTMKDQKTSPFSSQTPKASTTDSPIYVNEISSSSVFPNQPSREQLLQGVVWAEILGPPRSKKPYRK